MARNYSFIDGSNGHNGLEQTRSLTVKEIIIHILMA